MTALLFLDLAGRLLTFGPSLTQGAAALAGVGAVGLYEWSQSAHRQRHESSTAHGTAGWATRRQMAKAGLFEPQGLILGRQQGRMLRLVTDRHMLTLAATRSGKGVSTVLPNLLTWPGSAIVVDPKGENAMVSARRRRAMGHKVSILDPWGITGLKGAAFNPLDLLGRDGSELAEDAALIAEAIVTPSAKGDGLHWEEEARALITGLILHIVTSALPEQRNLAELRRLLTLGSAGFHHLLQKMAISNAADGLVARAANRQLQKEDREYSGVISSAQAHTHFLDSGRLGHCLASSSFDLSRIKQEPMTVYLVLPAKRLRSHARWLRLIIAVTLDLLCSEHAGPGYPVLVMLDEFAALGRLGAIETAMGLMAGYGVQLWPIVQDLSQLRDLYPDRWESFVANAHLQAFGINDPGGAEYLSRMLGICTVNVRSETASVHAAGSDHYTRIGRALLMPDEIRRLPADQQILLLHGMAPILASKLRYYQDKAFKDQFSPNPLVGGIHGHA